MVKILHIKSRFYGMWWDTYHEELAGVSVLMCGSSLDVSLSVAEQFRASSGINFTSVIDAVF